MNSFDHSREIVLFIDKLRINRNLSQEAFLTDIVSIRQYKRYLSGESTIPYNILEKLTTKLGFRADHIITELETEKVKQTQMINNLYNAVVNGQEIKISEYFGHISSDHLLSKSNELIYTHALHLNDYLLNKISEVSMIEKTKHLIDYDTLIKKKALSTAELLILTSFLQFDSFSDSVIVAGLLAAYMKKQISVVTSHNIRTFVLVLESLAKFYGYSKDYEKIIDCSKSAIEYSLAMRSFYLMDRLYYYLSYAYHSLGQIKLRDVYIKKCTAILEIEDNIAKKKRYQSIFKTQFNLDITI